MAPRAGSGAALVLVSAAGSEQEAVFIARTLVDERLAACVNIIGPVRSIYRWHNRIEDASEYLMLIKTRRSLYPRVERRVKALHSYEVPEVLAVSANRGSARYLQWLVESTGAPRP